MLIVKVKVSPAWNVPSVFVTVMFAEFGLVTVPLSKVRDNRISAAEEIPQRFSIVL